MPTDAEILTFAVRWIPYGGPPAEDVFVTYGLTYEQFRTRIAEAVVRERRHIPPTTAFALVELYKLTISEGAASAHSTHRPGQP